MADRAFQAFQIGGREGSLNSFSKPHRAQRRREASSAKALRQAAYLAEPLEARTLLAAVAPVGGEFLVNTTTADWQFDAAVDVDSAGNFVVVWESDVGDADHILAQRFDKLGVPQGGELRVNGSVTGLQPAITMTTNGDFVVVWEYGGVQAQRFDAAGVKQGSQFQVGSGGGADIANDSAGNFVVVWGNNND